MRSTLKVKSRIPLPAVIASHTLPHPACPGSYTSSRVAAVCSAAGIPKCDEGVRAVLAQRFEHPRVRHTTYLHAQQQWLARDWASPGALFTSNISCRSVYVYPACACYAFVSPSHLFCTWAPNRLLDLRDNLGSKPSRRNRSPLCCLGPRSSGAWGYSLLSFSLFGLCQQSAVCEGSHGLLSLHRRRVALGARRHGAQLLRLQGGVHHLQASSPLQVCAGVFEARTRASCTPLCRPHPRAWFFSTTSRCATVPP